MVLIKMYRKYKGDFMDSIKILSGISFRVTSGMARRKSIGKMTPSLMSELEEPVLICVDHDELGEMRFEAVEDAAEYIIDHMPVRQSQQASEEQVIAMVAHALQGDCVTYAGFTIRTCDSKPRPAKRERSSSMPPTMSKRGKLHPAADEQAIMQFEDDTEHDCKPNDSIKWMSDLDLDKEQGELAASVLGKHHIDDNLLEGMDIGEIMDMPDMPHGIKLKMKKKKLSKTD